MKIINGSLIMWNDCQYKRLYLHCKSFSFSHITITKATQFLLQNHDSKQ